MASQRSRMVCAVSHGLRPIGIGGGRKGRRQAPPKAAAPARLGQRRKPRRPGAAPARSASTCRSGSAGRENATRPDTSGRSQPSAAQAAGQRRHRRDVGARRQQGDIGPVGRSAGSADASIRRSRGSIDADARKAARPSRADGSSVAGSRRHGARGCRPAGRRRCAGRPASASIDHDAVRAVCGIMSAKRRGHVGLADRGRRGSERQMQIDVGAGARPDLPGARATAGPRASDAAAWESIRRRAAPRGDGNAALASMTTVLAPSARTPSIIWPSTSSCAGRCRQPPARQAPDKRCGASPDGRARSANCARCRPNWGSATGNSERSRKGPRCRRVPAPASGRRKIPAALATSSAGPV